MWPWGHVALGYLFYSLYVHWRHDRPPSAPAAIAVGVGTLLPDVIDKPLAWWAAVLPNGRSLAHSAVVMGLVLGLESPTATMELLTETPFGIDRLDYDTFQIDRDLTVNGGVTTIE